NQRLNEIARYYQNGDYNLGFRRLIDSAMDTGNTEILKDIINYTDWRYKNPEEISGDVSKALDLLNKIRNLGPKIHPLTDRNIIDAKNVSKRYARGNFQLGPLDVSIRPHEVVGLVGENGNGKTTLLRLL